MAANPRAQRSAHAIGTARRVLSVQRLRLAAATTPNDPPVIFPQPWRWMAKLLDERKTQIMKGSGVVGYSLGFRHRDGVYTDEPCITVFVREKLDRNIMCSRKLVPAPQRLGHRSKHVRVDVVPLGRLTRQSVLGESLGPLGDLRKGTLGAVAQDVATGASVAITAMHVSGHAQLPKPGVERVVMCVPSRQDQANSPVFGAAVAGTLKGIDACKVQIDPPNTLTPRILGIGKLRGWRPVVFPADRGTAVRMFGAVSQLQHGVIEHPFVALPQFQLDAAILVRIQSARGDSGAALVDAQNLVLGFLVGMAGPAHERLRIFCPAGLVLQRLGCDIPTLS